MKSGLTSPMVDTAAKCSALAALIWLCDISSVLIVCNDFHYGWRQCEKKLSLTWFTPNAVARCSKPASPIRLCVRSSIVSICDTSYSQITAQHHRHPLSLDSPSVQQQDAPHLHHRFHCWKYLVLWVSIWWTWSLQNTMDSSLTWFTFNALLRCPAPASPIWQPHRFSVLRPCNDCYQGITAKMLEQFTHPVHLQCSGELPHTCITDWVAGNIQHCERLWWP